MILLDIAIAAKLVNDHSSDYFLLKHHCYWYADVISAVLRKSFPKEVVVPDTTVKTDPPEDAEVAIEMFDPKKGGKYWIIPVYYRKLGQDDIDKVYADFIKTKSEISTSVCLLNTGYISAN
jgi:hypothetical protein